MLLLENISQDELKEYMKEFYNYALTRLKKIDRTPKVVFIHDEKNADDFFGKTGYYDAGEEKIALFVTGRHPKDILRSFAHELVHHHQICSGEDNDKDLSITTKDPAYALHDKGLRMMEKQAFRWGNMIFRDWCDMKKIQKKENTMAESKKFPLVTDKDDVDRDGDTKEKVPAFLDKGDVKQKKKGGKVPKQLQKYVKGRMKKNKKPVKESDTYGEVEAVGSESKKMNEGVEHPYPQLFEKRDRLFQERFSQHEEIIYQELLKRALKK